MYDALKNRLKNGVPFRKADAIARITALADALEITQDQANELTSLAQTHGVDTLPEDFTDRLDRLEEVSKKFELFLKAASESALLKAIVQRIESMRSEDTSN